MKKIDQNPDNEENNFPMPKLDQNLDDEKKQIKTQMIKENRSKPTTK